MELGGAADTDRPPAVSISGPNTVEPGSEATFEANAVDDDGIVSYSWRGAYSYEQSTATHTFADAPGETRRISLTVTDTAGQTATATKVVDISNDNRAPQIEVTPAVTGCVGDAMRVTPTIITEDGDTATGEWNRAMPIRMDSTGVTSATYTATDNHGATTYKAVRFTAMSCDGGQGDSTSMTETVSGQWKRSDCSLRNGRSDGDRWCRSAHHQSQRRYSGT
ncbi:MAG: PKD domain-containing protein [Halobacteriales archaeon]|nr:PKD domain-containing protein [Halobacteriales archaeon]